MVRKVLFIFCTLATVSSVFAQDANQKKEDLQDYRYKKEASGGVRIQTDGLSVYAEYGWIKDYHKTRLLQLEYTYYIDYQLKRQKSPDEDGDYVFGMQNHFHVIRLSYGIKRTIADKFDRSGVRLCFIAFGGFDLGLLKPYYLNVNVNTNEPDSAVVLKNIRYTGHNPTTDSLFLNSSAIQGAAPIRYGLDQIQPVPGLHGKMGLDFDWGKKDAIVKAIEAGVSLDVYYKVLPIMINDSNHFYQLAAYVSIGFGKRW